MVANWNHDDFAKKIHTNMRIFQMTDRNQVYKLEYTKELQKEHHSKDTRGFRLIDTVFN